MVYFHCLNNIHQDFINFRDLTILKMSLILKILSILKDFLNFKDFIDIIDNIDLTYFI